ncbi:MAG: divalent-cation tolerance protein CutA [Oceanicaulis sp.]|uniref:divalent-cation tolerance protein CutA n=1 Tax=Glycocaulis sp. TaxID=1969725 RepID=UPI0025BE504C|nr:divalent-cation tolerance protein CutA [Glycocaulis sp.]MCC5981162.1 divalent-cation tolerance protein CutA [Oceanicaulis sp.]MCH8522530.1 divalent-cation tolerance protein CutA [Glycocaulis sp.]
MADSGGAVILYTTWPDGDAAAQAAHTLLDEGLIACANIFPAGRSVFRWEGRIEDGAETVALFKTSPARAGDVRDRLIALHPYDEPCVLALDVDAATSAAGFLAWIGSETR